MKIFVPFELKDIGGTSSFARKFKAGLEVSGHEVTFTFCSDYDILFLIVQAPFSYIQHARQHKKRIVQRLDGVYYWSVAGWKFPFYNAKPALIRHLFSDMTIYQSNYSQHCVARFLGAKKNEHAVTIYNGVDTDHFRPEGSAKKLRDNPKQTIFFTASLFRRRDQILPLLAALRYYHQHHDTNFKCLIGGEFVGEVAQIPMHYKQLSYVHFTGKINNEELPLYERAADVFLHTHLNPPCPNNIIEAMACGLPICGLNDGAMPELVAHGKNGLLTEVSGSGFWLTRSFPVEAFAAHMRELVVNKNYREVSRIIAGRFSLEVMAEHYISALQALQA